MALNLRRAASRRGRSRDAGVPPSGGAMTGARTRGGGPAHINAGDPESLPGSGGVVDRRLRRRTAKSAFTGHLLM